MKKLLCRVLPFLTMFIIATGSVIVSCATTPSMNNDTSISLNVGRSMNGDFSTIWVFDEIRSVIIVNMEDRSRKIELTRDEWGYNRVTTELSILREIPYQEYVASIEGNVLFPHTFILNNLEEEEALAVILDDRLAIAGYDYSFEPENNQLVFRNDVNLKKNPWCISYQTPEGSSMLGEWEPDEQDKIDYLMAEHQNRYLNSWYDRQDSFWFFKTVRKDSDPDRINQKPELEKRSASPEELKQIKSNTVSVMKYRGQESFKTLTKELGFSASLPDHISIENSKIELSIFTKTIEEYASKGDIIRKLDVYYTSDRVSKNPDIMLEILLSPVNIDNELEKKPDFLIKEDTVNLGLPVQRSREWAMRTYTLNEEPEVISMTSWNWSDRTVNYSVSGDTSDEELYEDFIRQIIIMRQNL